MQTTSAHSFAVLFRCKLAGIILALFVVSTAGLSQDVPLVPRTVFGSTAEVK